MLPELVANGWRRCDWIAGKPSGSVVVAPSAAVVFGATIAMDPEHYSVPSTDTLWVLKNNQLVKAMP